MADRCLHAKERGVRGSVSRSRCATSGSWLQQLPLAGWCLLQVDSAEVLSQVGLKWHMKVWMSVNARSDVELLLAAPGEPSAFAEFYRRNERSMLLFFLRRTGSAELSADLTAEVFAAALGAVARFRPRTEVPAEAWLYGIARHVLSRSLRRARVEDRARRRLAMPPIELTDAIVESIEALDERRDGEAALSLLADLPTDQRAALQARVVDEREYGDIARELRCSEAVVRQRVSRGLANLRARMEEPT